MRRHVHPRAGHREAASPRGSGQLAGVLGLHTFQLGLQQQASGCRGGGSTELSLQEFMSKCLPLLIAYRLKQPLFS